MDPAVAFEEAILEKQKPMLQALAQGESEVQRFYKNSVVFVTGGSGFMGKQLIEKILRTCQISKLYMLLRYKKGTDIQTRLNHILNDPVFDKVREQLPNFCQKIIAINGNVGDVKLGINEEDWQNITEKVDVIFHIAATTKFDETLRTAALINIRGTREALLLGKACKQLRSFVHVSSTYSQATADRIGGEVKEEFHDSPVPPEIIISMAENLDVDTLNTITPSLTKGWPNTYVFTKFITEELIRNNSVGLPICIVRPALVLGTYYEPTPGWLDKNCSFGGMAFFIFVNLGLSHALFLKEDCNCDIIPCDYVNNAIIVAAMETAKKQTKGGNDTKIYAVCSSNRNPTTYQDIGNALRQEGRQFASPKAVYYNCAIFTSREYVFRLMSLLVHDIPAKVADFVFLLMGKETGFAKMAAKYKKLSIIISWIGTHEWNFVDKNLDNLYNSLSKQDQAIFNFDVKDINWKEYFLTMIVGARKYIYKDGLEDTEYAVKKQKCLKYFNYLFVTFYAYCIWKVTFLMYILGLNGGKLTADVFKRLVLSLKRW